jgi:hypothetical protein
LHLLRSSYSLSMVILCSLQLKILRKIKLANNLVQICLSLVFMLNFHYNIFMSSHLHIAYENSCVVISLLRVVSTQISPSPSLKTIICNLQKSRLVSALELKTLYLLLYYVYLILKFTKLIKWRKRRNPLVGRIYIVVFQFLPQQLQFEKFIYINEYHSSSLFIITTSMTSINVIL